MGRIFTFYLFFFISILSAQKYWTAVSLSPQVLSKSSTQPEYRLDFPALKAALQNAPLISDRKSAPVEVLLPTLGGNLERFRVFSFPVVAATLAKKYDLNSYIGTSAENPAKTVRFSLSKDDFQSMIMNENGYEFISPTSGSAQTFRVHAKTLKNESGFFCSAEESPKEIQQMQKMLSQNKKATQGILFKMQSSDRKYRTLRLAISVTGEYTQYFGGVENALRQINATLTRVNGIFEKDLALHLNLIDNVQIIYTNPSTDPYSPPSQIDNWNWELQKTLTAVVGEQNYDIGHLFGASGGGGNSGCFGCICVSPVVDANGVPVNPAEQQNVLGKGSGISSPANGVPIGDSFDLDFVIHEMGHQLGAYHTFSYVLEGTGTNVEPGSGSTIMGYAGITDADVQQHSDPYFHFVSIDQIQKNLIQKTCDIETPIANNPPILPSLNRFTIPKSTAFVLSAPAVDAEGDALTYTWEQTDDAAEPIKKVNLGKTKTGASFRSVLPNSDPARYFPKFSTVLAGKVAAPDSWEATSSVPRNSNYTVTVRDNHLDGAQTASETQSIEVGPDGPFKLTDNTIYTAAKSAVVWEVANTNLAPYNVPSVKIDYTTDEGLTWTVLSESTPNDGTEGFLFPAEILGKNLKIRVSALGNVFYAMGTHAVLASVACDAASPRNLFVSNIQKNAAVIAWEASTGNQYSVQYKLRNSESWTTVQSDTNSISISNLVDATFYDVRVAKICNATIGTYSEIFTFQTLNSLQYCILTAEDSSYEYISQVKLNGTTNPSQSSVYSDFTGDIERIFALKINSKGNVLEVTKGFSAQRFAAAVTAYIDYNRNGIFENSEIIMQSPLTLDSPVRSYFNVPENAVTNQLLRMRVILHDEELTSTCGQFQYGEVEDYSVLISADQYVPEGIVLYPNPVEEVLTVLNVADDAEYKIYNLAGQLVAKGNLEENSVNLAALSTGVYVIWLKDSNGDVSRKFLKK